MSNLYNQRLQPGPFSDDLYGPAENRGLVDTIGSEITISPYGVDDAEYDNRAVEYNLVSGRFPGQIGRRYLA